MAQKTVRRREETGALTGALAQVPEQVKKPAYDESGILSEAKRIAEIHAGLRSAGKIDIDGKTLVLALDEVRLVDRLLLLGPPGVGKSETIMNLSMDEAAREGRIFVDVRCLMKTGGCRIPFEYLDLIENEKRRQELIEWLKARGSNKIVYNEKGEPKSIIVTVDDVVADPSKFYLYLRVSAPHVFPEDLQFPKADSGSGGVEFLLPRAFHLFTLPGIKGTLFLDEITNVQRDDQMAMYYTLVLDKELGYAGKLQDDVYVVAAGNPPEYSSIARGLPAALLDRFVVVNIKPPTVHEWIEYMNKMYGNRWNKVIGAFLLRYAEEGRSDVFIGKPSAEETLNKFPTPRSWTYLARLDADGIARYAAGIVGTEAAQLLYQFLQSLPPTLEELNKNPRKFETLKLDAKYLVLAELAMLGPEKSVEKAGNLILWLFTNDPEHMATLMVLSHVQYGSTGEMWRKALKKIIPDDRQLDKLMDHVIKILNMRRYFTPS